MKLDCPFCGEYPSTGSRKYSDVYVGMIECDNHSCHARAHVVAFAETLDEALAAAQKAWNTRASIWKPIDTAPKDHAILIKDKYGKVWLVTYSLYNIVHGNECYAWTTDGEVPTHIEEAVSWREIPQ